MHFFGHEVQYVDYVTSEGYNLVENVNDVDFMINLKKEQSKTNAVMDKSKLEEIKKNDKSIVEFYESLDLERARKRQKKK